MLKIVLVGMGPIGCLTAANFKGRKSVTLAGAVDPAPGKAGASVGELAGVEEFNGLRVDEDICSALERTMPDAVILATVSSLEELFPQIESAAPYGADIVSTCEELSFPWATQPGIAGKIDGLAKKHGITVLGTGVNPGFLMDYLPSVMTGLCREIKSIRVCRFQDASSRRLPFRKKIGEGLGISEFSELRKKGALRHVGLAESAYMLAEGAGMELERVDEEIEAVTSGSDVSFSGGTIPAGRVLGVRQTALGYADGSEVIRFEFRASIGEEKIFDSIEIDGVPSFASVISGGINGDTATCALAVNAVRRAVSATPGLKTMLEVPAATYSP